MADTPGYKDYFKIGRDEILNKNPSISTDVVDQAGTDANAYVGVTAAMAEQVSKENSDKYKKMMVDTASGADLDRLAFDRYQLLRKAAAAALGVVSFTRPTAAGGALVIPQGTIVSTADGVQFQTLAATSFTGSDLGPETCYCAALIAGSAGNILENAITTISTQLADTSLVATNPARFAGGDEAETDDTFKQRIKRFFITIQRGTFSALEFCALTVPGVRQAIASEYLQPNLIPAAVVKLMIADANGYASAPLISAVQSALLEYKAAGIQVTVFGGTPIMIAVIIELAFPAGVDQTAITAQVKQAILNQINSLSPGETLLARDILNAARSIKNVIVANNALTTPVGDTIPEDNQVLRTTLDMISTTVTATPGMVVLGTYRQVGFIQ